MIVNQDGPALQGSSPHGPSAFGMERGHVHLCWGFYKTDIL